MIYLKEWLIMIEWAIMMLLTKTIIIIGGKNWIQGEYLEF